MVRGFEVLHDVAVVPHYGGIGLGNIYAIVTKGGDIERTGNSNTEHMRLELTNKTRKT